MIALQHRPELLILDEPTSGLDPLVQQSFYELVREAQAEGRTVFLSSHILSEVEKTCDRVAIIRDGAAGQGRPHRRRCATSPTTRWSCGSPTARARPTRSRPRRRLRRRASTTTRSGCGSRADHAGRPGRRALRAARLREPRAVARGDVPRRSTAGEAAEEERHDRRARPRRAGRRRRTDDLGRSAGSTASAASTRRRSATRALALIIVVRPDRGAAAPLERHRVRRGLHDRRVAARSSQTSSARLPPAMAGVYGNPFPISIETLGGSIAWKTARVARAHAPRCGRSSRCRGRSPARSGAGASSSSRRRRSASAGSRSRSSPRTSTGDGDRRRRHDARAR